MSDALKPCPFCGGEATDWEVGTFSLDSSYDMFGCEKCGIGFDTGRDSENEILWNTRATDRIEEIEAERDALQAKLDRLVSVLEGEEDRGYCLSPKAYTALAELKGSGEKQDDVWDCPTG